MSVRSVNLTSEERDILCVAITAVCSSFAYLLLYLYMSKIMVLKLF